MGCIDIFLWTEVSCIIWVHLHLSLRLRWPFGSLKVVMLLGSTRWSVPWGSFLACRSPQRCMYTVVLPWPDLRLFVGIHCLLAIVSNPVKGFVRSWFRSPFLGKVCRNSYFLTERRVSVVLEFLSNILKIRRGRGVGAWNGSFSCTPLANGWIYIHNLRTNQTNINTNTRKYAHTKT